MLRLPIPLLSAAICLAGLALVAAVGLGWPAGHSLDTSVLREFSGVYEPRLERPTSVVAATVGILPYAASGLLLVSVALVGRRGWRALIVLALLLATGTTTQIFKAAISTHRSGGWLQNAPIADNSWPSGHATAAMTLALCAVIVVPPSLRAATALLGGIFTVMVGYALLIRASHYPSDVLGGYLVATFWASLGLAGLGLVERPGAKAGNPRRGQAIAIFVVGAMLVAVGAFVLRSFVVPFPLGGPSLALGAMFVALTALGLVSMIAASLDRRPRSRRRVDEPAGGPQHDVLVFRPRQVEQGREA
jgi:membrane-associated phospholipid phosphatase